MTIQFEKGTKCAHSGRVQRLGYLWMMDTSEPVQESTGSWRNPVPGRQQVHGC